MTPADLKCHSEAIMTVEIPLLARVPRSLVSDIASVAAELRAALPLISALIVGESLLAVDLTLFSASKPRVPITPSKGGEGRAKLNAKSDPHDNYFEDEFGLRELVVFVCVGQYWDGKRNKFGEVNEEGRQTTDDIKNRASEKKRPRQRN